MKNLLGVSTPTKSIFKSISMFMLVLFATIGFVSCDDQSNSGVLPKSEVNLKTDFHKEANPSESLSRCTCGLCSDGEIGGCKGIKGECTSFARDSIGGGKSSSGTLQRTSSEASEIGGRNTTSTGNYSSREIGGSKDNVIIKRETNRDSLEVGGKSTTIGQ
ncbi:hypothetical protein Q361_105163 [Flavobacterium croceum DSM 17960]|uniref:Lipoprotein n=1 Tax=Flavobacterium croceum DSM 17960 TaxID=1121886 RepID=A0A2S4N989_9FLAO|nr:hypothetical protein [Flavobacterium croceum]POS02268.1 hypothetical protein Q361_105163 [Flavobacterium croceum DSM 17960]